MKMPNLFRRVHSQSMTVRLSLPGTASISWTASFKDADKLAAWELYVEMATTVVTQPMGDESGDESTALHSLYSLFPTTREILRRHGQPANECGKVAIAMLNQGVRPFTTKWHREALSGAFNDKLKQQEFRTELAELQKHLLNYVEQLQKIAGVTGFPDPQDPKGEPLVPTSTEA